MKKSSTSELPESNPTDSIAVEIKKAREAKGLSFSDLHRLTGISRTTLHDYESGRSKPGARELLRLCEILEASPNRLLLGTETPYIGSGGVLLSLVGLARTKPEKALALSMMLVPLVAAVLSKIGNESLVALATMADETLRARDPETFLHLAKMVAEFEKLDAVALSKMPADQQQEVIADIQNSVGLPPKNYGLDA